MKIYLVKITEDFVLTDTFAEILGQIGLNEISIAINLPLKWNKHGIVTGDLINLNVPELGDDHMWQRIIYVLKKTEIVKGNIFIGLFGLAPNSINLLCLYLKDKFVNEDIDFFLFETNVGDLSHSINFAKIDIRELREKDFW